MITSSQNPLVKELQLLQKKKKERNLQGVFVVEGLRAVNEIPGSWHIYKYIIAESFASDAMQLIEGREVPVFYVADHIFTTITDTKTPQGIMAVVAQPTYNIDEIMATEEGFFIIGDEIQDPGNLGTLIRTAHAAGAHGVFLSKGCVDLYNPKTIRATMGSIFHIPVFIDQQMTELIPSLITYNTRIYATDVETGTTLYDCNWKQKIAIAIGNEANGITEQTKQMVDHFITIPMPGEAESLNASIAAGICMFEVVRQRMDNMTKN